MNEKGNSNHNASIDNIYISDSEIDYLLLLIRTHIFCFLQLLGEFGERSRFITSQSHSWHRLEIKYLLNKVRWGIELVAWGCLNQLWPITGLSWPMVEQEGIQTNQSHRRKTSCQQKKMFHPVSFVNHWRQGNGPTFQPTDRPTESDRKRPRHPTGKVLQRDDSVPCLSKKFSMMPSDRIENSARWHVLLVFYRFLFTFFLWICQRSAP